MLKKIKTKKRRLVVREICVEFVAKNVGTGFQKASRWVSVNMQKIFLAKQPSNPVSQEMALLQPSKYHQEIYQSIRQTCMGGREVAKNEVPPPPPPKIQIFINKVLVIFMTIDFKTTACLEGEGQTEMTVTQAEQPWSGRLLFPAAALPLLWWLLLLLLLRVVVLLWVCRPFLTGISSYSLSLSTPLSVRSAKGKNGAFSYKNYVSNKLYQWRRFFSGNSLGVWDFSTIIIGHTSDHSSHGGEV